MKILFLKIWHLKRSMIEMEKVTRKMNELYANAPFYVSKRIFRSTLAFIFLFACQPHSQQDGKHAQSEHGHHHQTANEHMHQRSFEELVAAFEDPKREDWQMTDSLVRYLDRYAKGVSGKKIAEIGAGTGYISFRLAKTAKEVIGIDIDTAFLAFMEKQKITYREDIQAKITTRLCALDDPKLTPGEVDMIVIVNSYHHIEDRVNYFAELLDKTQELVIVDFKKEELPIGPPMDHKLDQEVVFRELYQAGWTQARVDDRVLPYQYVVVAKP